LGIRCTGKGRAAQRLEGFDVVVALLTPLLVDGALGLGLARLGLDADPAWCHAAIRRPPAARAIPLLQRQPGRRLCVGQELLGRGHGRRDAGAPREAGSGQLGQLLGAREGTGGHERGRAGVGSGAIGSLKTWPNAVPS
jgi:hypothetical protein